MGLGLTIVRSLVQLHGGKVSVRSEGTGKGSEFTVELPAIDLAHVLESHSGAAEATDGGRRGKRILVVDDNDDAAEMFKMALEQLGYSVEVAHDGPTALNAASWFKPDIALIDIGLPVMDGYELARRLRELQDPAEELHLVTVTGYGQDSDRRRSRAAGFEQHLVKPVDIGRLCRIVASLCEQHS